MRLAEGIRSNIRTHKRLIAFLEDNEQFGDDWSVEKEALEQELEVLERELEDTENGDLWVRGPISEQERIFRVRGIGYHV